MDVVKYTRPLTEGDLIAVEFDRNYCRERRPLLAGSGSARTIAAFTVMAGILLGTPTSAAKSGGNTGTGTFVLDGTTPLLAGAMSGIYTLRCTVAGTNSATFRLRDPKNRVLGDYAFSGSGATVTTDSQVKGVITDAVTDFIVGDGFDITVPVGSGKSVALDLTKNDGSQIARGVALAAASAPDGTDDVVDEVARGPIVLRSDVPLVWPGGATDAQKANGLAELLALGIVARTSG
ncbi:MAG TPA: head decoration protein [Rhizomicrobium sp.]